eukprot:466807-Prorocentrum_lima.AAC.1
MDVPGTASWVTALQNGLDTTTTQIVLEPTVPYNHLPRTTHEGARHAPENMAGEAPASSSCNRLCPWSQ